MIYWSSKACEFIWVHSCWKHFQGTFSFPPEIMYLKVHFEIVMVFVSCTFNIKKESPHLHLMKWASRLGFILPICQGDMRMGENLTELGFRSGNGEHQEFCLKRAILHLTVSSYFLNFHLKVKFNMSRSCSSSLEFIGPYQTKSTSNKNAFRYIQSQSNEDWQHM